MKCAVTYLILSMLATMLIFYLIYPVPRVIIKYPNFKYDVSDKYIDDKGKTYRYFRKEINCPKNGI